MIQEIALKEDDWRSSDMRYRIITSYAHFPYHKYLLLGTGLVFMNSYAETYS